MFRHGVLLVKRIRQHRNFWSEQIARLSVAAQQTLGDQSAQQMVSGRYRETGREGESLA